MENNDNNTKVLLRHRLLFILTLGVILFSALLTYFLFIRQASNYQIGVSAEADEAVRKAQEIFRQRKERGEDLRTGPCISNNLLNNNWAADLVHSPRTRSDDLPANLCSAFVEGRVNHLVELDLDGNVVKVE